MDLDLGAAGDSSTRRKMDATSESVEITPLELYDSARAKIAANLRWLFAKAYGIGNVCLSLHKSCRVTGEWPCFQLVSAQQRQSKMLSLCLQHRSGT